MVKTCISQQEFIKPGFLLPIAMAASQSEVILDFNIDFP